MWLLLALGLTQCFCAAAYDNGAPHSRTPPLGWSSWVALGPGSGGPHAEHPVFDFCDAVSVKASIDAYSEVGLFDAGYRHFHLDDCWADPLRNASGFLQANRQNFPDGMKPIVDYAHSKGLVFGLYTCAGNETCYGGLPGSKDHWQQDANVFAEWGVDVVKMDWCHTEGMEPIEAYGNMSAALNRSGRHIHFNMCEWGNDDPWKWGPSMAQSWRATGDHLGTWNSTKKVIGLRSAIPPELGGAAYAWNDMDMLETGNGKQAAWGFHALSTMNATEYRTEFSMWAIFASPLVVTTPILNCSTGSCRPSITDLQKEILLNTEVIAINQDVTPAGRLVAPTSPNATGLKVFMRSLSDGSIAVALYNAEDEPREGFVDFSLLGWPSGTAAFVRDLWAHADLGVTKDRYPTGHGNVTVEAHATTVLRLRKYSSSSAASLLV